MVKVDITGAQDFFDTPGPDYGAAAAAHRLLSEGKGAGVEFTGWITLPDWVIETELKSILSAAHRIRSHSQILLVIGIGGSYLGARAAIEFICSPQHNKFSDEPAIYFTGNSLSPRHFSELIRLIGDRDFSINVISKSGTTLEPAIAFRIFKELLEKKYGAAGAKKRIYITTDANNGTMKSLANTEGYDTFIIPDNVGGRYSVLSAVGLLPMAVAGIDISRILTRARDYMQELDLRSPENPAWKYAAARQHLYLRGKTIEILASYEPAFQYMTEWWKQLFGESEGKNGVGIYPASVQYTADLHSLGQYIQDGPRHLMETVVSFSDTACNLKVPFSIGDSDGLNYLAGHNLSSVNNIVQESVRQAHIFGGVPNILIEAEGIDEDAFASLVCFFEMACAISGYMSGVNPFDQPGVDVYKSSMFKLLGR